MSSIQQITIEQQLAEIGVHVTPAQMHIERQQMKMDVTTESPQMEIDRQNPSFRINRKKINAETGLKSSNELSRDWRDRGREAALRSVKTAVEDGDFLGDLRRRGDRVSRLAHQKAQTAILRKKDMNIGLMPKSTPQVEWEKGHMRINWSKHSIVIDWDGEYMPKVTVDPKYSIEVYLRTEPYFRIIVEETEAPGVPGKIVNKAI